MFVKYFEKYNILLISWKFEVDHINIRFKAHPKTELMKFVNAYKSSTNRLIKKEFAEIKETLSKEMFWSHSFCLLTTGSFDKKILKILFKARENNFKRSFLL